MTPFDNVAGGNESITTPSMLREQSRLTAQRCWRPLGAMTFETLSALEGANDSVLITPRPQDIAFIMYTSGTTGPAKGVVMPHAHSYAFGYNMARAAQMTEADCQYVCMPIFHGMGLLMQVIGSLVSATRTYCVERFSPTAGSTTCGSVEQTVTNALGVMPEMLYRTPETKHDRDNKMRIVIAVPIAAEWARRWNIGSVSGSCKLLAARKTSIICYTNLDDPLLPGMAGHVLDDLYEVRVVDAETDAPVPQGEIGEIVVRPQIPFLLQSRLFPYGGQDRRSLAQSLVPHRRRRILRCRKSTVFRRPD